MIKTWYCNCAEFEEKHFHELYKTLPASLSEDVMRYSYLKDKAARLIARLLIRKAIIETGFSEALLLSWQKDLHEKPFISKWMPFNISHSKDMVIIAFGGQSALGIDIEHIERDLDTDSLLSYFHPAEKELLLNSRQKDRFFHLWARKEAVLKGIGTGIKQGLQQFDCSSGDSITYNNNRWQLQEIITEKEYVSYLAFQNQESREIKKIEWQELLTAG